MAERAAAVLSGTGEAADWALKLWEKANKVMSGLALRLRLGPQSGVKRRRSRGRSLGASAFAWSRHSGKTGVPPGRIEMATARRRKQTACATDAPLPPTVVRLYARALEIENEVEEVVADGDMTVEEQLAWSERLRQGTLDRDAEEAKAKAAILAQHKEYQWTKRELGPLLGLGPEDINPLERR
jgi:hypothetical protein